MANKQPSLLTATDELASVIGEELAGHFIAHRRALKKPMTAFAGKLMANKLRGFPDPVASVEQSIIKGWQDCFPVEATLLHKPQRSQTGVAAEREKLRLEIENERDQSQAREDSGHAGWLLEFDRQGTDRPH